MATPKKSTDSTRPAKDSQAELEYRMSLEAAEKAGEIVRGWTRRPSDAAESPAK